MVSTAMERYGALSTLVNNAAPTELMGPGRLDRRVTELENDAWDSIMLVALKGRWSGRASTRIPAMTSRPAVAAIVNISSAASILGTPGSTPTPRPRAR
jgi:NAD(P)-dependent dehydrogenase (short-subunit alcohol dehydrogenase family)